MVPAIHPQDLTSQKSPIDVENNTRTDVFRKPPDHQQNVVFPSVHRCFFESHQMSLANLINSRQTETALSGTSSKSLMVVSKSTKAPGVPVKISATWGLEPDRPTTGGLLFNVGKTMPFLPPMTGNGKHTIQIDGVWMDDLWHCFTHLPTILRIVPPCCHLNSRVRNWTHRWTCGKFWSHCEIGWYSCEPSHVFLNQLFNHHVAPLKWLCHLVHPHF